MKLLFDHQIKSGDFIYIIFVHSSVSVTYA